MTIARALGLSLAILAAACRPAPSSQAASAPPAEAAWAFPGEGAPSGPAPAATKTYRLPGASGSHTEAELHDLFRAVDWRPDGHPPAPRSVLAGRPPDAMACGFCHMPGGQGRPENAALAGLGAAYIRAQAADIRSGARSSVAPDWRPIASMRRTARAATDTEVAAAADYFAGLKFVSRVRVVETAVIGKARGAAYVYRLAPGAVTEALGERIVETPASFDRFEMRDPDGGYIAFVPPGSLARGRALAAGAGGRIQPCAACHGLALMGGPQAPPIGGRSPTGLFRQLYAFKVSARNGAAAAPMKTEVAPLTTADLLALAAYVGSIKG